MFGVCSSGFVSALWCCSFFGFSVSVREKVADATAAPITPPSHSSRPWRTPVQPWPAFMSMGQAKLPGGTRLSHACSLLGRQIAPERVPRAFGAFVLQGTLRGGARNAARDIPSELGWKTTLRKAPCPAPARILFLMHYNPSSHACLYKMAPTWALSLHNCLKCAML